MVGGERHIIVYISQIHISVYHNLDNLTLFCFPAHTGVRMIDGDQVGAGR